MRQSCQIFRDCDGKKRVGSGRRGAGADAKLKTYRGIRHKTTPRVFLLQQMETLAEWQDNLDEIEAILALNPADEDALARKETTIAYMAFLKEKERQHEQGTERAEDGKPNFSTRAESPIVPSKVNVDQMMTLFTIAMTIKATSLPSRHAEDTSEVETEAKRRCIQSLSTDLLTLLQQLATDEAKGEFATFLGSNGFTSMVDFGITRYKQLKNDTVKILAAEGYAAHTPSSDTEQEASNDTVVGDDGVAIVPVASTVGTKTANNVQGLNAVYDERSASDASERNAQIGRGLPQDAGVDTGRCLPQDAMGGLMACDANSIQEDHDNGNGQDNREPKAKKTRKKDRRKKKTDTGEAVDLESYIDSTTEVNNAFVSRVRSERDQAESLSEEETVLVLGKCNIFLPMLMQVLSVITVVKALHEIELTATVFGRVIKPMMAVIARAQARALEAEGNKSKRKVANIKKKYAFGDVDQPVSVLLHAYDDPDDEEEQPSRIKDPLEEAAKAATKRFGKNSNSWISIVATAKACQTIMSTLTNLVTVIRVYRQVTLDEIINGCSPAIKKRVVEAKKKFEEAVSKAGDKLHIGDMTIADIYDEYLLPHTRPSADASTRLLAIALMSEITTRLGYQEWSHLFTAAEAVPLTVLFGSLHRGQIKALAEKISDPFYGDQVKRTRAARIGESLLCVHQAAAALGRNKPEEEKRDIQKDLPLAILCLAPSNFKGSGISFLSDSRLQSDSVDIEYVKELLDIETDSTESEAVNELYKSLRSAMLAGEKEHLFTDISDDLHTGSNSTESLLSRYFEYLPAAVKEIEATASEVEE